MGIAVLLSINFGGLAYGYAVLDYFKSPMQVYLEAEIKNVNGIVEWVKNDYQTYYEEYIQPRQEQTVHSKAEVSIGIKGMPPSNPVTPVIEDILQKSKFVMHSAADQKNQVYYNKMDFYKKYAFANLKDRDIIKERYEIENLPKRFITHDEYIATFKLTPEEEMVLKEFGKIYIDSLSAEKVTLQKTTFERTQHRLRSEGTND